VSRRLTTKDFMDKSVLLHGDLYNYSNVEYVGNKQHVDIECKVHGIFRQSPSKHLSGQGCPTCASVKRGLASTGNTQEFISKAEVLHQHTYDYSLVEYISAKVKVEVVCKEHSSFWQTPNEHLSGRGCPSCAKNIVRRPRLTQQEFISMCKQQHGDKYDYSGTVYRTMDDLVNIVCKEHGMFSQSSRAHSVGKGCQKCMKTGYRTNKPGVFYVLQSSDGTTKVGITNRKVGVRAKEIADSSGKDFTVSFFIKFQDGEVAKKLEEIVLKQLSEECFKTDDKHDGHTECFKAVEINALLLNVSEACCTILTNKE